MILEVQIKAPGSGNNRTLQFSKSPVRIGRNQLNDISIEDPFVSEWHGTIRFDNEGVAYFDLGSTNGTLLDGKRLAKNVAVELSADSRLQLGLIDLLVSRRSEPTAAPRPPTIKANAGGTLEWNRADMGLDMLRPPGLEKGQSPSTTGAVGARAGAAGGADTGGLSGSRSPAAAAAQGSPSGPIPTSRSAGGAARLESGIGKQPAGGAMAGPPPSEADLMEVMERQQRLLDAFAEAFIGLRKGYEQFGAEVGVRTINGTTPLHRARSRSELLEYLFQRNADVSIIARDLVAIFADFGIHHIAMMQGVTEGARATVKSLSPGANDIDPGGRLFSGARAKNQWKAYVERFEQMITDDNELHAALFGSHFARAYASVTLGNGDQMGVGDDADEQADSWKR